MPAYVAAFDSTHAAMEADALLRDVDHALIPTPSKISAGCGIALRFSAEGDDAARSKMAGVFASQQEFRLYREAKEGGAERVSRYVLL